MELLSSIVAQTLLPATAVLIAGGAMLGYRMLATHIRQSREAKMRAHPQWRTGATDLNR